ncbi:MAG: hypothetical protein FWD23_03295 [Oscillospiraceae bacterium]|nr:hypothetical protein [Oscillospiraceae bacterium]
MNYNEVTKGGKDYVGYDYKTLTVESDKASMFLDAYENFGWLSDGVQERQLGGTVILKLKRDRKILNKMELTRLQQHFEACIDEIETLEKSKIKTATVYSIAVGLIGTVFMAGSVFAVTAEPPMILLCVLLGIPGIIGWSIPYSLFKLFSKKRTIQITPLIEQKYDEMHEICEKGNALTH